MTKFINNSVAIVFKAFCVLIFITKIYSFNETLWFLAAKATGIQPNAVVLFITFVLIAAVIAAAALLAFRLFRKYFPSIKARINKISPLALGLTIFFVSLILRLASIFILQSDFTKHIDMRNALSFAEQIAKSGRITENAAYALQYGRYVNIGLLLAPAIKLFGASAFAVSAVSSVLFSAAYVAWFDILRIKTNKVRAFICCTALSVLPNEVLLVNLLLHEAISFFAITAFCWLCFAFLPRVGKRLWIKCVIYVCACIALAVGAVCNPMGYVAVIAVVLIIVAKAFAAKLSFKRLAAAFACVVLTLGLALGLSSALHCAQESIVDASAVEESERREAASAPLSWWLYVGSSYASNGQWLLDDYYRFYPSDDEVPDEELYEYQMGLLKKRYGDYLHDPLKYLRFLFNKVNATYGANTYTLGTSYDFSTSRFIPKTLYLIALRLISIPWIFLSFLLLFVPVFKKERRQDISALLKTLLCGAFTVLLFVETTPKYVSCFWALLLIIITLEWGSISERLSKLKSLIKKN